jgi:transcriptional regulator with XRE-family HTH domain
MQSVNEMLDGIKSRHSIPSDYKLAAYLGVVPGAVKHWRHGRSLPDARVASRLASELGIDPDVLVAQLEAQRASTDEARALWQRIAARLQGGAVHSFVLACLVALGFMTTPPNAVAAVTDLTPSNSSGLYIM